MASWYTLTPKAKMNSGVLCLKKHMPSNDILFTYSKQMFIVELVFRVNGTYEALDGGNLSDALLDFSGGISEVISLKDGNYTTDEEKRTELYKRLLKHKENHALMCCAVEVRTIHPIHLYKLISNWINYSGYHQWRKGSSNCCGSCQGPCIRHHSYSQGEFKGHTASRIFEVNLVIWRYW